MRTEKEIRDKLDLLLIDLKEEKEEFNKCSFYFDKKDLLDIHESLLETETAIAFLKWVLGE